MTAETCRAISAEEACEIMRPAAVRYAQRFGSRGWDIVDDLVQEGLIGAIEAAKTFDPKRNLKFATYAQLRVRGRMLDYIRDHCDHLSRVDRQSVKAGGEEPYRVMSIDRGKRAGKGENDSNAGQNRWRYDPSHHDPEPSDGTAAEFMAFVRRLAVPLRAVERDILRWYYVDGVPMKVIGKRIGLGESRVSQIHSGIMGRLSQAEADRIAEAWAEAGA